MRRGHGLYGLLGKVVGRQSLEGSVCSGALLCCSVAGGHQDHRQVAAGLGEPAEGVPRGGHHETAGPPAHHQAVPGQAQAQSLSVLRHNCVLFRKNELHVSVLTGCLQANNTVLETDKSRKTCVYNLELGLL